ncbi:outer membrane lipoprotein carrier protein LolA [Pseudomonas sp.]|uniref:outer membrane lipoprotein carrier protein LolA n=1 Tax=Pseudomonas sp. TaxID=306 RepID=UPI0028AE0587|nr:outer membrane lipoprotein carrier protein LolA [Pseudomonas sp.]
MTRPWRTALLWLGALLATTGAQAFDLQQLDRQLSQPAVVRGDFVQEKHLRALAQPLVSRGHFVLARDSGLLWRLRSPLEQDYRISDVGVARRDGDQWRNGEQARTTAQFNRLFLAALRGDSSVLAKDFELQLSGSPERWELAMTPRSALLKQVFTHILISGGATPTRLELYETQGDSTLVQLQNTEIDQQLRADERHDFAH